MQKLVCTARARARARASHISGMWRVGGPSMLCGSSSERSRRVLRQTPSMIKKRQDNYRGYEGLDYKSFKGPGCDFEHWEVWPRPMKMKGSPTKHEIIQYYISILARVLGSEDQAIPKIYSVATRQYYAFGANVDADIADKIFDLPNVCYILPHAYHDPIEKRYPWDPFINGEAHPYDPKYYPPAKVEPWMNDRELDILCEVRAPIAEEKNESVVNAPLLNRALDVGLPDGLDDGLDYEHWQIYTEPLSSSAATAGIDEIIRYYINILAQVLGSEEEAVKKIYSVATRHCYGFGAKVSMEIADKIRDVANVGFVVPDSYLDPIEKRYPWEPFVNGQALQYDPKNYQRVVRNFDQAYRGTAER